MTATKIFGIAGWKNSGKTGLMVRLVSELTRRGFVVSLPSRPDHHHRWNAAGNDDQRDGPRKSG